MALNETQAHDAAEAMVQSFCGWHIAPSVREVLELDGEDSRVAFLPTLRLTELHSLSVNGTALDLTQVEWSRTGVIRWPFLSTTTLADYLGWDRDPTYSHPRGRFRGVQAEVTHGYEAWPGDLLAVVDRLAGRIQNDPGNVVQVGQVRVGMDRLGVPLGGSLTAADRAALQHYKIPARP